MTNTVLIVDDNEVELKTFAMAFEHHGIRAVTTDNPNDVVSLAIGFKPDFIILDLYMGDKTGFDVCRQLKMERRTRSIPVMFVTASDKIDDAVQSLHLGCIDYIHKPVNLKDLVSTVIKHKVVSTIQDAYKPIRSSLERFAEKYSEEGSAKDEEI